jgi:hypothetical protein
MRLSVSFPRPDTVQDSARHIDREEPIFLTHEGVSGDIYVKPEDTSEELADAVVDIRLTGQACFRL